MTSNVTLQTPRAPAGSWAPPDLQPRPRRIRPSAWVALAVVVLVVATAGWLVAFSPVLAARQVQVTGVTALTTDQVRSAAVVPIGRPLIRQDLDAIAKRVAGLRLVRTVQVSRRWPQTVTIAVQERTAVIAVAQPQGFALVDNQGHAYADVPSVPLGVVLADVYPANAALLTDAGTVAAALPDELERRVRRITATSSDRFELRLTDGDVVRWGSAEESELKARVVLPLLKLKATTYDVSAPRNPALR